MAQSSKEQKGKKLNPADKKVILTLEPEITSLLEYNAYGYDYDVQIVKTNEVKTVLIGKFYIVRDVTRKIT